MKRSQIIPVLFLFLAATTPVAAQDESKVIAVVNGTEITSDQRPGRAGESFSADFEALSREQKSQLTMALINRQLVLEQARKEGFDQSERIREATRALVDTYIVEQFMLSVAVGFDLGEKELRAYYEEHFTNTPEQYLVSHILLDSKESAQDVLSQLAGGVPFGALARSASNDPVSAGKGGEMGWLTEDEMAPAFFRAVSSLSEGEVYDEPLRTQSGWHVARLDDRRNTTPPRFEDVLPRIQEQLMREKMAAYLESLRSGAAIQIINPNQAAGKPFPEHSESR